MISFEVLYPIVWCLTQSGGIVGDHCQAQSPLVAVWWFDSKDVIDIDKMLVCEL